MHIKVCFANQTLVWFGLVGWGFLIVCLLVGFFNSIFSSQESNAKNVYEDYFLVNRYFVSFYALLFILIINAVHKLLFVLNICPVIILMSSLVVYKVVKEKR